MKVEINMRKNRKNVDFADFYAPVLPTGVKT